MDRSNSSSSLDGTRATQLLEREKKTEELEKQDSTEKPPLMLSKDGQKNGASKQDADKNLKGSTQTKTIPNLNQVFNKDSLGSDQASGSTSSSISKRNSSATKIDSDQMGLSSTKPIVRSSSSTANATSTSSTSLADSMWEQFPWKQFGDNNRSEMGPIASSIGNTASTSTANAISTPHKSLADSLWENSPWQAHDVSSRFEMRPTMNFDNVCNWLASSPKGVTEALFFSYGLGDAHVVALAKALKGNTTLKRLDLGLNSIGTEGAKALAVLLKDDTSLTNLDLWNNNIGDDGADALAEALKINKTLSTLVVSQNDISTDAANNLKDAAKLNKINIELDEE